MGILSRLLGLPDKGFINEKINSGAMLLDVRTKEEYEAGNVKGSINIPLAQLPGEVSRVSRERPIIAVCESGVRSAQAVRFLKQHGFESYNGGGWESFNPG